ncbi:MAG: 50S ribosomal protein L19 [Candidatus Yanofskybacteria bacterium RIFCSPHIGHO2_02_FULL_43_22]|uniref:50S ribosomal protein L19 n=1 Tax=Candidatus Yanofskybacteria bacterium RIFCSPHIGHO2_02_FULL_43_22 TaxID=1802681 RepID=A0A1F8FLV8_9BACT|nr:MAG: 50S ribosomal protein L19 [Candidatus Yanofskybacteria bacterium RIFCSPHIGHO2_02_FULL_43_22]
MDKLSLFNRNNSGQNPSASWRTDLKTGWTVKVYQKIKEGDKSRIQAFEGIIIARKHGNEPGGTITVRKVSGGIGVEKTFPLHLPTITKIDVVKKAGTRKSKLYYLRDKSARETRKKIKAKQNTLNKEVNPA